MNEKIVIKIFLAVIFILIVIALATMSRASSEEDIWYPNVVSIDGVEYVLREDFDYVYNIVRELEESSLEIIEYPTVEITSTEDGQIFARFLPDQNNLRIKVGYIDKSIVMPASWLSGNVVFGLDWNSEDREIRFDNSNAYLDYWSFILSSNFTLSYINATLFGIGLNTSLYTPFLLSRFRGFATLSYNYAFILPTTDNNYYHIPKLELGIMFYYNIR